MRLSKYTMRKALLMRALLILLLSFQLSSFRVINTKAPNRHLNIVTSQLVQHNTALYVASNHDVTKVTENEKKSLFTDTTKRSIKFALFSLLFIRAFMVNSLIDFVKLTSYIFASFLATSCALRRIEDCYSFGYGGSLLVIGLLNGLDLLNAFYGLVGVNWSLSKLTEPLSILNLFQNNNKNVQLVILSCFLQIFSYVLYGVRMVYFISKRNTSASYLTSPRYLRMSEMDKKTPINKRLFIWLSTAILLGLFYSLPLHLHIAATLKSLPTLLGKVAYKFNRWPVIASSVASVTAIAAVGVQHVADTQKHNHKQEVYNNPKPTDLPFCNTGLFKIWRHPNYVAEFVYHVSILLASLLPIISTQLSWSSVLLVLPGPVIFGSIITAATRALEKRQKEDYGSSKDERVAKAYNDWVSNSRRFL